ncbi:MAG TPA: hypothetical protein VGE63_01715 [Candidatus Paceibacterota bacterium]
MNRVENEFFDINKFPAEKGILLFPISMSRILNRQSAPECLKDIRHLSPSKISKPLVGLNFVYGDFLYLSSDKPAAELKNTFMTQVINHKNEMSKLLSKNTTQFQIQNAFNYMVWNQMYLGTVNFNIKLSEIKSLYKQDEKFQQYIKEDADFFKRELTENQVNFFLEEHLMFYLLSRGKVRLPNDFIQDHQKWILWCYPGKQPKALIYLMQLNPFKLDWPENKYQNAAYNLDEKNLIEFDRVNLETYTYE